MYLTGEICPRTRPIVTGRPPKRPKQHESPSSTIRLQRLTTSEETSHRTTPTITTQEEEETTGQDPITSPQPSSEQPSPLIRDIMIRVERDMLLYVAVPMMSLVIIGLGVVIGCYTRLRACCWRAKYRIRRLRRQHGARAKDPVQVSMVSSTTHHLEIPAPPTLDFPINSRERSSTTTFSTKPRSRPIPAQLSASEMFTVLEDEDNRQSGSSGSLSDDSYEQRLSLSAVSAQAKVHRK